MIFEKQFEQAHAATFGQPGTLVMGSGPWEIKSLDPTKGEELSANPHWWGGKIPIQHVSFTFFANETSEAMAFRAGEIDFTFFVSSPRSFTALSGTKPLSAQSCSNGFFSMNITQPGWNDVHVRRAVAYALNRTDIIAAAGGYAAPIYTFTPPSLLNSIASQSQINALLNSIPLYQYNLTKARQEMAQSAYPHGFSATIVSPTGGNTTTLNQVAAAELAKIGIRLTIKQMDANAVGALEVGPDGQRPTGMSGGFCFPTRPEHLQRLPRQPQPCARSLQRSGLRTTGGGQATRAGTRRVQPRATVRGLLQALRPAPGRPALGGALCHRR
jgi:peptide/nickel transport system substrate-binding protein